MLDEKALRKPSWDEASGEWVTLTDGQQWLFPKPWVDVYPKFVDGVPVLGSETNFGPEFDAKLKAAKDATSDDDFCLTVFVLAMDMLGRNYTLAEADYSALVRWRRGSAMGESIISAAYGIAQGTSGPKATPVGSEPGS
jgi:hypothetical protein